jgi:hypothetical protein
MIFGVGKIMSPIEKRPTKPERLQRAVALWGMRIFWTLIVIVFALIELHFIPIVTHDANAYLVVVTTLMLFLSELFNQLQHESISRLDALARDVKAVQEDLRSDARLLTLEESVRELFDRLNIIKPGQEVVIEHLGLDMTFAWEKMSLLFQRLPNLTKIEYRALILLADDSELVHYDTSTQDWMLSGRRQKAFMEQKLEELKNRYAREHKTFNAELRGYTAVPFVHGLRVVEPFHAAYIAVCRWGGEDHNEYHWGGNEYHRVIDVSLSNARRDLLDIYNGNFSHFWNHKKVAKT